MAIIKHQCDNCEALHDLEDLAIIKDYSERVEDGEVEPTGECPDCGCLCHEVTVTVRPRFKVTQNADQYATVAVFGETRELTELDALYETAINDSLDLIRELAKVGYPVLPASPTPAEQVKAMAAFALKFTDLINKARTIPGAYEMKES